MAPEKRVIFCHVALYATSKSAAPSPSTSPTPQTAWLVHHVPPNSRWWRRLPSAPEYTSTYGGPVPYAKSIQAATATDCLELTRAALDGIQEKHPRVREVMDEFNRRRAASTIETLLGKKDD